MTKRLYVKKSRMTKMRPEWIKEFTTSIKERTQVLNAHLDQVSAGQSDLLLFSEHLDKYIGNMILINNRIKELLGP